MLTHEHRNRYKHDRGFRRSVAVGIWGRKRPHTWPWGWNRYLAGGPAITGAAAGSKTQTELQHYFLAWYRARLPFFCPATTDPLWLSSAQSWHTLKWEKNYLNCFTNVAAFWWNANFTNNFPTKNALFTNNVSLSHTYILCFVFTPYWHEQIGLFKDRNEK